MCRGDKSIMNALILFIGIAIVILTIRYMEKKIEAKKEKSFKVLKNVKFNIWE